MPPVIYLIDGHALAYRAYFALTAGGSNDSLKTTSGEPTAGLFGFASVLIRLLSQEHPEYLAVAFDTGKTFRNEMYPDYKATRAKMPDDLRLQIDRIRQMVDAFNLPRLELEGVEADDILGTLAHQAVAKGLGVKIITGDRDLWQLVDDRIIVNLAGGRMADAQDFTAADVMAAWGVRPDQVVDYKALVGDHSDNIPGVKGVGEKTAVGLLQTYSTLDNIYAHLDEIKGAVRTKLESDKEMAYLSRDLATIRTNVNVALDLEKARTQNLDLPAVESFFRMMEFRTLIPRLNALAPLSSAPAGGQLSLFGEAVRSIGTPETYALDWKVVNTPEALADLKARLEAAPLIALDTETTSTNAMSANLVGISLAVEEGTGYYLPVGHQTGEAQLPLEQVVNALRPALNNPQIPKSGHNLKYDVLVLENHGLHVQPLSFDTMIAGWLLEPATHRLGLKDMAEDLLNISMTHIEELIGKGKNQISMAQVSIERAAPYAAADAEVTLRLTPLLKERLQKQNALDLMKNIEAPLIPVLVEMEHTGIALDTTFLKGMSETLNQRITEIEIEIYRAVGYNFNLNSTQQLSKVLFETLHLAPPDRGKKTASGHFSTSADVLEELRGEHPVVDLILEYRELAKLKSTYVEALPLEINARTGRVHTSYSQTGSVTGRLASSDPNLQNIPTRTDLGRTVRQAFVAAPGYVLLSVDYSQIELRIVAHMSGDEAMLSAFRQGQDIHAATAAAIYNVPIDQVTKAQRRHAKAINFGLIYGMSSFGLSRTTDLTLGEAENFVKAYFQQFPGVKSYLDNMRRSAAQMGYVETLFGRRRYFPNLKNATNQNIRNREEREAINAPIQGTAADLLKMAMIRLPAALKTAKLSANILLQVHDELVLECPRTELVRTAAEVQSVMENVYQISIPMLTEARWGKNWGEMQPLNEFQL
jgi:DNA polymerase-1